MEGCRLDGVASQRRCFENLDARKMTRMKANQLLATYGGVDDASITAYENVIDELAELFDVSRQAAKVRLMDLGYSKAEGAYPFGRWSVCSWIFI